MKTKKHYKPGDVLPDGVIVDAVEDKVIPLGRLHSRSRGLPGPPIRRFYKWCNEQIAAGWRQHEAEMLEQEKRAAKEAAKAAKQAAETKKCHGCSARLPVAGPTRCEHCAARNRRAVKRFHERHGRRGRPPVAPAEQVVVAPVQRDEATSDLHISDELAAAAERASHANGGVAAAEAAF